MKSMGLPGYYHNDFEATYAIGRMMLIWALGLSTHVHMCMKGHFETTTHDIPKCIMSCQKALNVKTGRHGVLTLLNPPLLFLNDIGDKFAMSIR